MIHIRSNVVPLSALFVGALVMVACGASRPALKADMRPIHLEVAPEAPLTDNHFKRDKMGAVTEYDMKAILAAPVYLEHGARIGIVPVATRYDIDQDVPVTQVPGSLAEALQDSGHFEVVSEVSTDWPSARSISGLRELATRYRAEYLLLYRHRFVDRSYTNAWALGYLTLVGALFVPAETMETAGVVEATLFDVKTGTLLFTVFERVYALSEENLWQQARKRADMKKSLLTQATKVLADNVLEKVGALVAARPQPPLPPARASVLSH